MLSLFLLALDKIMLEDPHTNLVKTGSKIFLNLMKLSLLIHVMIINLR